MKKSISPPSFYISKIYCSIFGHNYVTSKQVTHHIKEYTCSHCGEQATTNSRGKLELMTPKLREINDLLASVHAKKIARNKSKINLQTAS